MSLHANIEGKSNERLPPVPTRPKSLRPKAAPNLLLSIKVLRSHFMMGGAAAPEYEDVRMMFSIWELLSGVARFFRARGR
jgi:hypothetical protein